MPEIWKRSREMDELGLLPSQYHERGMALAKGGFINRCGDYFKISKMKNKALRNEIYKVDNDIRTPHSSMLRELLRQMVAEARKRKLNGIHTRYLTNI